MSVVDDRDLVWIDYVNYKGVRAWRHIRPCDFSWGMNEFHPEWQWLLSAYDMEKRLWRTFAMKDIKEWRTSEPTTR